MRGTQPWRTNRSRVLRSQATSAEDKLWQRLHNRQLGRLKFVRQANIGPYFVDFVCRDKSLVIEVDGATHGEAEDIAFDQARTNRLEQLGYRVFRVHNSEVFENLDGVFETLLAALGGDLEQEAREC